ncbi:MAG: VOC family protein [Pseudomonadales bacterium]|nr:VOC family protein [Pseudomonadales bacterium]
MGLNIVKDSIDLGIVTTNRDEMLAFYNEVLGLEVEGVIDMPTGAQMTRLKCGTTVIKLMVNPKAPPAANPPGGIGGGTGMRYFTISVDNLDAATEECAAAGRKVVVKPNEIRPGVKISIIEDPDGNWVELLQMG